MTAAWTDAWAPLVAAVGSEAKTGEPIAGADPVELGSLRRFCEPLEFDCPLHFDEETAKAHGYPGVIAPYASYMTYAISPLWSPGDEPIFVDEERDSQPRGSAIRPPATGFEPPYSGFFATDFEIEFTAPVLVGDRLARAGTLLVECTLKETSVGRGAFTTWERRYENQRGEPVALVRIGMYLYDPHEQ